MRDIRLLKLKTGDDLIAECEQVEEGYIVKNPALVAMTPQGVAMMPWLALYDVEQVCLPHDYVLFVGIPKLELTNGYNERFGSGIVTAQANVLDQTGKLAL